MEALPIPPDERIAKYVRRRYGVVSRNELAALGVGKSAIKHRLAAGRLRRIHRGVYAVGHQALSMGALWRAAVLALGSRAALSHSSAASLWRILVGNAGRLVHVTAESQRRPQPGIAVHRGLLPLSETTIRNGIPVTTPARTIVDLCAEIDHPSLVRVVREAEFRGLVTFTEIRTILDRYPRRRGTAKLRRIAGLADGGFQITRSELEFRFLEFCGRFGLPLPETNVMVGAGDRAFEVDCLWREARLIAELDGRAAHATEGAFERDRERDRVLLAAGIRTMRVTWRQLHTEPTDVARDLMSAINL